MIDSLTVLRGCQAACGGLECQLNDLCADCNFLNVVYFVNHFDECIEAALAEWACEERMSCVPGEDHVPDPLTHPICGTTAARFQEVCGYAPVPPPECEAYCNNVVACRPGSGLGDCTQACNIMLGARAMAYTRACGDAYLNVYACYASMSCDEISLLIEENDSSPCNGVLETTSPACVDTP